MIPTGIVFITSDNANIQLTIVIDVNKLGINNENPFALLAKPFAAVPKITASIRIMKAITLLTIKEYSYLVILSTNFFIGDPNIRAANIAIGKLIVQAFKNLFIYWLSIPVFIKVIIKVINKLIPKPIISMNNKLLCFLENIF